MNWSALSPLNMKFHQLQDGFDFLDQPDPSYIYDQIDANADAHKYYSDKEKQLLHK